MMVFETQRGGQSSISNVVLILVVVDDGLWGFALQEWEDTEDSRRYGAYLCVVLNGKNYSLSSPTKIKLGNLIDNTLNPKKEEGAWSAQGGLADLLKGFSDLSDENLSKIEDFFLEPKKGNGARKPIPRKMWVRWIVTQRGGQSSISNVLWNKGEPKGSPLFFFTQGKM